MQPTGAADIEALYLHHGPALLLFAVAITGEPSRGQDVIHQVFLRLIESVFEASVDPLCAALVARIPVLRCVLWGLRRRLLRGNTRRREGTIPIDSARKVHGSRNRQEARDRAYEQCIILESQQ